MQRAPPCTQACPCQRAYDTGQVPTTPDDGTQRTHVVWLAKLHLDNETYAPQRWLRDYWLLPTDWLTTLLSGSDIIHVQLLFWSHAQGSFLTYSVDAHARRVYATADRNFTRRGWDFIRLPVTRGQELDMARFATEQMDRPYNTAGAYCLFVWPLATDHTSWFCSQLCCAALQHAGLLPPDTEPGAVSPARLCALVMRHVPGATPCTHPVRNKYFWQNIAAIIAAAPPTWRAPPLPAPPPLRPLPRHTQNSV